MNLFQRFITWLTRGYVPINSGPRGAHQYLRIINWWDHIEVWQDGKHARYESYEDWEACERAQSATESHAEVNQP